MPWPIVKSAPHLCLVFDLRASLLHCVCLAVSRKTTRHGGYEVSQRIRQRIEEGGRSASAGWAKAVAGLRKARHRGPPKIDWQFTPAMAACNLFRLPKLLETPA